MKLMSMRTARDDHVEKILKALQFEYDVIDDLDVLEAFKIMNTPTIIDDDFHAWSDWHEFFKHNIILYSLGPGCPSCTALKEKLTALGIPFTEITEHEKLVETGYSIFPVLSIKVNHVDTRDYTYKESLKMLKEMEN